MRNRLMDNLRLIFSSAEDVIFLTDDQSLVDWLTTYAVTAATFDQVLAHGGTAPSQVIAMPLDWARIPSRRDLLATLSRSSVLWIPLASFSSDLEVAKYAVERFAEIDLARAVAMNRRIITRLLLAPGEVTFSGPETALRVGLPDVLQLSSRTRLELLPDEQSALGNYFEVGWSPADLSGRIDIAMSISGTLRVDTVLAAKHRDLKGARAEQFAEAVGIAAEMRKACPLHISIRDSRIVDGLGPWTKGIDDMSGPEYRGAITEMAFGTGSLPPDRVDWSLNCQINESAAGVHLGVGNGITGIHFDFISAGAWLNGA
ncbi:hypothetical protein ACIBJI_23965 [Nocardia sp. NPDC050408]|uniref:hypothetical protein n=1 Tax=Nocardia sp. NPDC050408 TaxID=3364319 RepID=UPI00378C8006